MNMNATDRSCVQKLVRRSGKQPVRRADRLGVKPGLLLEAVVQSGLGNYVYPFTYEAKKSLFRSGI